MLPHALQLKEADKVTQYQPGQQLDVAEMFKAGDMVDIAGTTIGKGFQGAASHNSSADVSMMNVCGVHKHPPICSFLRLLAVSDCAACQHFYRCYQEVGSQAW